jgi:hypothetical protein
MNIQSIKTDVVSVPAKTKAAVPAKVKDSEVEVQPDPVQVERKAQLLAKLKSQNEVRPEVLERAKQIAADTTYPSNELMSRLTRIFLTK